ncbi:hypothetical protein PLICRDRAFT_580673 [Plicaturopsis crispa FD-325 SS-3]|nr:hypothetical protein PLICRDRAFT_580673 [Plicaturopsis crispa FD-325 SS-3]
MLVFVTALLATSWFHQTLAKVHHLVTGTFQTPYLYTLQFDDETLALNLTANTTVAGGHSWLTLSPSKKFLYGTVWSIPAGLASYSLSPSAVPTLLSNASFGATNPLYVAASKSALYAVGGGIGTVYAVSDDGHLGDLVQGLTFDNSSEAHGIELTPDGKWAYVADIEANQIWSYSVDPVNGSLNLLSEVPSPGLGDGPRHTWYHPNGKYAYVLEQDSSQVAFYSINDSTGALLYDGTALSILPEGLNATNYWADEVRLSASSSVLFASNRGQKSGGPSNQSNATAPNGYLYGFSLTPNGSVASASPLFVYETATSGGAANAITPFLSEDGREWIALTDSEVGSVSMLEFTGNNVTEVARVFVEDGGCCANAVWVN